ncbi:MAG: hypothetical protein JNM90_15025 [Burkholderiales bacterium]|nr:hypothetical protein [Burkholderiales bacterium]
MNARLLLLLALAAAPAVQAQPWSIQGPGGLSGPPRGAEERKGAYQDRRASFDHGRERDQRDGFGRGARQGEPPPHHGMSHEERRELRRQIRDHGRDIYRER